MGELKIEMNPDNASRVGKETKEDLNLSPVVSKNAIVSTKRPLSQRIGDNLFASTLKDSMTNIVKTVVIPGIQNAILDSLSILFFDKTADKRKGYKDKDSRFSYGSIYRSRNNTDYQRRGADAREHRYYKVRNNVSYKNIVLERMDDAKKIVDDLHDIISSRGYATVSDLFNMLGLDSDFTDQDWGWTTTGDIGIRIVSEGYLIDVNDAVYIR